MLAPSPRILPALALAALVACNQPPSQPTTTAAAPVADPPETKTPKPASANPGEDWKFEFKDPPAGPRAPTYTAFNVTLGTSKFDEVDKLVQHLGLDCGDTSIRAMMDRRREKELQRIEEAKAKGEDAVTAASWVNRRSKREANPQVRFSCPKITADKLADRARKPSNGRLLYVFDSIDYPLRHASYQRSHNDGAAALADFQDTVDALTKIYGAPTKPMKGELPAPDKDGHVELPSAVNFEVAWEYVDLVVRTNLLRYGKMVTIGERVEIPHGIRPDAPHIGDGAPKPAAPTRLPEVTRAPDSKSAADAKAPAKAETKAPAKTDAKADAKAPAKAPAG